MIGKSPGCVTFRGTPKMYLNLIGKGPGFVPCGSNLTHFWAPIRHPRSRAKLAILFSFLVFIPSHTFLLYERIYMSGLSLGTVVGLPRSIVQSADYFT